MERDRLRTIIEVLHNRLSQHIKGAAKEDVVGRGANDVKLQVDNDRAEANRDIASEAKRRVEVAIRTLHVEDHGGVERKAESVTQAFRHRDNCGATVEDARYSCSPLEHAFNGANWERMCRSLEQR